MAKKKPRMNPKVIAALDKGFHQGTLGHMFSSPLAPEAEHLGSYSPADAEALARKTQRSHELLRAWLDWHGAETFADDGGRIVGVFGCFCAECKPKITDFVCEAGIDLIAQGAGDRTIRRVSDEEARSELRTISRKDAELEARIAQLCADLALEICERVAAEVATRISRQEARAVAREVAQTIAGGYARRVTRQMLISQAGLEQAAMMNHNQGGG